MTLTLGLLASVLVLLPGLSMLAAFNFRTRRGGARRPELPLTAVSALVIAAVFSIVAHFVAYLISALAIDFALAVHEAEPWIDFGPVMPNPLGAFFTAVEGRDMPLPAAVGLAAVLLLEAFTAAQFIMSDMFELAFEKQDLNAQGWVFEHVTRPAENGYTPVGHVFTSTMSGRFGIAYKGPIIDLRQGDRGEVVALALARPERFLYELGGPDEPERVPRGWWRRPRAPEPASGVRHHEREYAGGVVALDARVINNIVVHCIANALLEEIDTVVEDDGLGTSP